MAQVVRLDVGLQSANCKACSKTMPLSEFYLYQNGKPRPQCKACVRARTAMSKVSRRPKRPTSEQQFKYNLKKIGLTPEVYQAMLSSQLGKCAVCRAATVGCKGRKLFIDHCHVTGKVRGLLCHNCNAGIGHFKDSKERLLLAIRYIEDHENG